MNRESERQNTCLRDFLVWISSLLVSTSTNKDRCIQDFDTTIQVIQTEVEKKEKAAVLFLENLS